jgi:hypothetical protein
MTRRLASSDLDELLVAATCVMHLTRQEEFPVLQGANNISCMDNRWLSPCAFTDITPDLRGSRFVCENWFVVS